MIPPLVWLMALSRDLARLVRRHAIILGYPKFAIKKCTSRLLASRVGCGLLAGEGFGNSGFGVIGSSHQFIEPAIEDEVMRVCC